jgi:hypothetical protein
MSDDKFHADAYHTVCKYQLALVLMIHADEIV